MTSFTRYRMSLDLTTFQEKVHVPERYRILPISINDLDALAMLEIQGYKDSLDFSLRPELQNINSCKNFFIKMFSGKMGKFLKNLSFKILSGQKLCGAIYTFDDKGIAYIADFVIAPECRGQGLGRLLLTYALNRYKDTGYKQVALAVTETNKIAIKLYEKLGFKIEKTFLAESKED